MTDVLCLARYEPDEPGGFTHICDAVTGHLLPHRCRVCGGEWTEPGGTVTHRRPSGHVGLLAPE